MLSIKHIVTNNDEIKAVKALFEEYSKELNENLCFQHFDEELENPLKKYGPPSGCLLLAFWNHEPAGCVAIQPLEEKETCEMKRLYVRPQYRKHGIADELVKLLLTDARERGYERMVLDTLNRLEPAIRLYVRYGFTHTSPYYKNPLANVVYMEKFLTI